MKLLALDTSTERLSVALQCVQAGSLQVWEHEAAGGAQASLHLIAAIEALMAQSGLRYQDLDALVFGRGPGSFTGLRTACAVVQGLAWAANIPVLPIDTLLAVAEDARVRYAPDLQHCRVLALMDARMDEMYLGCYTFDSGNWLSDGPVQLVSAENLEVPVRDLWAGNVFEIYGARLPRHPAPRCPALPSATALLRLAAQAWAEGRCVSAAQALPYYVRDKVAWTTQERLARKALS